MFLCIKCGVGGGGGEEYDMIRIMKYDILIVISILDIPFMCLTGVIYALTLDRCGIFMIK